MTPNFQNKAEILQHFVKCGYVGSDCSKSSCSGSFSVSKNTIGLQFSGPTPEKINPLPIPSLSSPVAPRGALSGLGGMCPGRSLFPARRRRPMKSRAFRHPVAVRVSLE